MHTGKQFVPGAFLDNDGAGGKQHKRVQRQRPEVRVDAPVFLRWNADPGIAAWLARVAAGIDYLGRSDSPAIVALADAPDARLHELSPHPDGELSLRVPQPGRLDQLRAAHAALLRAPEAQRVAYTTAQDAAPSPWGELFALRTRRGTLRETAVLGRQLRAAAMSRADDPLPAALHGHDIPGRPRAGDADHAAWLALPDVGHRWARGDLLGAGMLLPRRVESAERDACATAFYRVERIERTPLYRAAAGERLPVGLSASAWARPATCWRTVTPIVLDRHPKRGEAPETLVADAAERSGWPRPIAVELPYRTLPNVPPAAVFIGGGPGHRVHAVLRFARPVRGPMLIGRGRYFGLGLLRPEVD
jgi:CRISPR-associated protein Csb2